MMKDYRRMMEQVTLSDRKKEEIMDMLENKQPQKRRMPAVAKIALAAALAVGCVLSIAAGLPAQVYSFMTGGTLTVFPGTDYSIIEVSANSPVTLEDGRIMLAVNGKKLDITDKIDGNTPYIVENTDEANGTCGYFIAGGTPEDFGWVELPILDGLVAGASGCNFEKDWYTMPDGTVICLSDLPVQEQMKLAEENGNGHLALTYTVTNTPWFQAALDQLGLEW